MFLVERLSDAFLPQDKTNPIKLHAEFKSADVYSELCGIPLHGYRYATQETAHHQELSA